MARKAKSVIRKRDPASREERLALSDRDRKVFFEVLMTPPPANERIGRAFEAARRRVRAYNNAKEADRICASSRLLRLTIEKLLAEPGAPTGST